MSKNLSAKYYQENKEKVQNMLMKDIKIFLKKEKEKKGQYESVYPKCHFMFLIN